MTHDEIEQINSIAFGLSIALGAVLGYVAGVITDESILVIGDMIGSVL